MTDHPIQPLETGSDGTIRFKENKIVRVLLDFSTNKGMGLNEIAGMKFSCEDRAQFAQLIGYSLNGAYDLSYIPTSLLEAAGIMHKEGKTELQAKLEVAERCLSDAREGMRGAIAQMYGIHPDDLKGTEF